MKTHYFTINLKGSLNPRLTYLLSEVLTRHDEPDYHMSSMDGVITVYFQRKSSSLWAAIVGVLADISIIDVQLLNIIVDYNDQIGTSPNS